MRTPPLLAALAAALALGGPRALPPLEVGARVGWARAPGDAAKDSLWRSAAA